MAIEKEFFDGFTEGNGASQQNGNADGGQSNEGQSQQSAAADNGADDGGGANQPGIVIELNKNGDGANQNQQQGQQQQPAFNFEQELEKRFGVKPEVVTERLSSYQTLEQKANAKSYLSAFGEEFDKLVSPVENGGKGIPAEVAIKYLSDTSKMSNRDYKAMIMKIEHGQKFTDSEIQDLIDLDYTLGNQAGVKEGDDEAVRSEKEKLGQLKLKRDVEALRSKEKEFKDKMLEPYNSKGSIDASETQRKALAAEATRKQTWQAKQTELMNNFKVFKIPVGEKEVKDKDGNVVKEPAGWFPLPVSDDVRKKVATEVARYVEDNKELLPDDRGIKFVTETLFTLAMYQHAMPSIAYELIRHGNSKERGAWAKELNNASFLDGNSRTFDTGAQGANEDFYDFMMKKVA